MAKAFTFGIIGGSGATGSMVVSALHKSSPCNLLVGGRDLGKCQALTAQFDARVSAALVDVLNPASLDMFCSQCSIIINCAGPVALLQDRVAQAALRTHCHYIDPAGVTLVKEHMHSHAEDIAAERLSFVISAGWMPGLSELLAVYVHARAKARMEPVESVTIYLADSGDWSRSALFDAAWFVHKRGLSGPGYFRAGEPVRVKSSQVMRKVALGNPLPTGRFAMYFTPELEAVGRRLKDCDVYALSYLSGLRTIVDSTLMAIVPLPEGLAIRMMRNIFRRNRMPVGGFAAVDVRGREHGKPALMSARITFELGRDYWIHGTTIATVARLVADGKGVQPGLNYLADAFEPEVLVAALGEAGIAVESAWNP